MRVYDEQVLARHGNGRYTIALTEVPLYLQGSAPVRHKARFANLTLAPKVPLHSLGAANTSQLVSAGASIGTKAITPSIVSATGATGIAAGALTAGIGAGIAILAGVILGLLAKHNARVAGAKAENQAINSAVQFFDDGLKAIFDAANSSDLTKNVSGPQAAQQVQALFGQFWQAMNPYMHSAGTADTSGGGTNCGSGVINPAGPCQGTIGGHVCDKSCTATCCVGCQDLYPVMLQAVQVFNNPAGGTVQVCTVYGSKYGANQRSGYSLTYTPPKITVSSAASSLLSDLTGSSASGILSDLTGSSGSSLLPLALAAVVAWAVFS